MAETSVKRPQSEGDVPASDPDAPLLDGLARNATTQFVARMFGIAAQGVALIVVARRLGPAEYGYFALVSSLTLMTTTLADWGLLLVGAREAATRPAEQERILSASLGLRLMLGVGAAVALVALSFAASSDSEVHLAALVAGSSFLPGAWFTVGHIRAQIDLRLERVAVPLLIGSLASMAWLFVALELGGGVVALSGCFVVASVASAVVCWLMTPTRLPFVPRPDPELWRSLMRDSTPVALALLCVTIYFYVDALLLARLSTTEQLGLYDSAYRFVQVAPLVPSILVNSVFALAARHAEDDRDRLRLFVREFVSLIAVFVPLALLLLASAPTDLMTFIYGSAYADAGPLLAILAVAVVLMIFSGVAGPLLVALGHERSNLAIGVAAAVINVAANLVLIPMLDARGAAIATAGTELVVLTAVCVLLRRNLGPRLDGRQLLKVTFAGAVGALLVIVLPGHVLFRIGTGVVVYIAILAATGAIGRHQLELTRSADPAPNAAA